MLYVLYIVKTFTNFERSFFLGYIQLTRERNCSRLAEKSTQTHDNGGSYEIIMVQQLIVLWVRR